MTLAYDKYYQTENLFGAIYPELLDFFTKYPMKGKIVDLGCGQGRDSIPLARIRYEVTGIDSSKVGIEQMNQIARKENLKLNGIIANIYNYDHLNGYDFILLNSMFHFEKKDRIKETQFIENIISKIAKGCIIIFCIQDTGKKVSILKDIIKLEVEVHQIEDIKFKYTYDTNGYQSETAYRLIAIKKF